MQRLYVENIAQFDHVVLNTTTPRDMLQQVRNLVSAYRAGSIRRSSRGPVVFLVAAASGTGKRTLMDAMFTLGRRSIKESQKPQAGYFTLMMVPKSITCRKPAWRDQISNTTFITRNTASIQR